MRLASRVLLPPWLAAADVVRGQSRLLEGLPADLRRYLVGRDMLAAPAEYPFDSADAAFDERGDRRRRPSPGSAPWIS